MPQVRDKETFRLMIMHRLLTITQALDKVNPALATRPLTIGNVHAQLHVIFDLLTALDKTIHNFTNEYYSRKEK